MIMQKSVALLYWGEDPAGKGIADVIKNALAGSPTLSEKAPVFEINKSPLFISDDDIDRLGVDKGSHIIVLSKHSSESGKPSLTVHPTGNPTGEASLGGSPYRLAFSTPILMKLLLSNLTMKAAGGGYEGFYIGFEATHHGPTDVHYPICFIEIGSTSSMWVRPDLHRLVGRAVADALESYFKFTEKGCVVATSFGENHYPARLTRKVIEKNVCVGHIITRYALRGVNEDVIKQAVTKSDPPAELVLLEKNSVSRSMESLILNIINPLGIRAEYY